MPTIDRRQGLNAGAAIKVPCVAATTANITLSGEQTIDGVACVTNDRVLVKNQTTASENGIYEVDTGTWDRARDWDGRFDVVTGTLVPINSGTLNGDSFWKVDTSGTITIGTTAVAFTQSVVASLPGFTVSPFMQTVIDDLTAGAGIETLRGDLSDEPSPAIDDELLIRDTSATTGKRMTFANWLKVINALTEDTSPDTGTDYAISFDASAGAVKKVLLGRASVVPFAGTAETLKVTNNATSPNSQLDATAGRLVLWNSSGVAVVLTSLSATADLSLSGVSGLDTGSEAADTWYYPHAIRKTSPLTAVSVTGSATNDTITYTAHGLAANSPVQFGGTAVPTGLTAGVTYYVRDVLTDTFKVAAAPGGAAIDLTSDGTAVTMTEVPALLLSTSSGTPVLPSGYTHWARIGACRNDGSSNLIEIVQRGKTVFYKTEQSVLSAGTATIETEVSVSAVVPPNADYFILNLSGNRSAASTGTCTIRFITGLDWYVIPIGSAATNSKIGLQIEFPNESQRFYYLNDSAQNSINGRIAGFRLP